MSENLVSSEELDDWEKWGAPHPLESIVESLIATVRNRDNAIKQYNAIANERFDQVTDLMKQKNILCEALDRASDLLRHDHPAYVLLQKVLGDISG